MENSVVQPLIERSLSCMLSVSFKIFLKQSVTKRTAYTKAKEYGSQGYKHSEGL